MLLNVASYEPHTVVPERSHAGEQLTLVLEGEFEIAGETRLLPGTVAHIPPHVPHPARTRDVGCVQVDVFSPPRRVLLDLLGRGTGPTAAEPAAPASLRIGADVGGTTLRSCARRPRAP